MVEKSIHAKTARMANMDLLRIISMMFVIVLHFLDKGGALLYPNIRDFPVYGYVLWGVEALSIVAVNVYMLISGYFLINGSFQVKRLLNLLLQLLFYSIGVGLIAGAFGLLPEEGITIYYLAQIFFPVSTNHYWFMTAYIFMYLFVPLLSLGVRRMSKKQFQIVLFILIFTFSIMKSISPIPLATDLHGYDVVWYLCVFLVAAYIRMYGFSFFKNGKKSLIVYLLMAFLIWGTMLCLRFIFLKTGKLENILTYSYEYNHIFVLAASVALFYFFTFITIKSSFLEKIIRKIAPYTLGVYLLHEHTAIRYEWPKLIFQITGIPVNGVQWMLSLVLSVFLIFIAGICVDMLRGFLFHGIHVILSHFTVYRKLIEWITGLSIECQKEEKL